jgi:hypothetical protein
LIRLSIARWIASASLAAMLPAVNSSITLNARVRTSRSVMRATLAMRALFSGLNFARLLFLIFPLQGAPKAVLFVLLAVLHHTPNDEFGKSDYQIFEARILFLASFEFALFARRVD